MIQPVVPGPVVKLRLRKARNLSQVVVADVSHAASAMANLQNFTILWAKMWTTVNPSIMGQATAFWKVRALSKELISFKGVRRRKVATDLQQDNGDIDIKNKGYCDRTTAGGRERIKYRLNFF